MQYVAFLRGINVGKHQRIKMDELKKVLAKLGFKNLSTYIQSGNVLFDSDEKDEIALGKKIEKLLKDELDFDVATAVRSMDHLRKLLASQPFKGRMRDDFHLHNIIFLTDTPKGTLDLPMWSAKKDVEVFGQKGLEVFQVIHLPENRRVNAFPALEKALGVPGTARAWQMLETFMTKYPA